MDIKKIFLIGMPTAGKTTLGVILAKHYNILFLDLDQIIEKKTRLTIKNIFDMYGENYFRKLEKKYLYQSIYKHTTFIMALGGGTPCYHKNIILMNTFGTTIFLNIPLYIIKYRLNKKTDNQRPLFQQINTDELKNIYYNRIDYYQQSHFTLNQKQICSLYSKLSKTKTT